MNTEKVKISPLYLTLIRQLHQDKVEINDRKIARLGSIDIDDHGFIDFPEFHFEPQVCEDGLVHGCALIGKTSAGFSMRCPNISTEAARWPAAGWVPWIGSCL